MHLTTRETGASEGKRATQRTQGQWPSWTSPEPSDSQANFPRVSQAQLPASASRPRSPPQTGTLSYLFLDILFGKISQNKLLIQSIPNSSATCPPWSCLFLLEKRSKRGSLRELLPASSRQPPQTYAYTRVHRLTHSHTCACTHTLTHTTGMSSGGQSTAGKVQPYPVLDSSHPHPSAWCAHMSPGTGSSLPQREKEPGPGPLPPSQSVALAGRPQPGAGRPGTSQLGEAGVAQARWPGSAGRRPCASLPSRAPSPSGPRRKEQVEHPAVEPGVGARVSPRPSGAGCAGLSGVSAGQASQPGAGAGK